MTSFLHSDASRLEKLDVAIRLLWSAAADLDDPAEADAYYAQAEQLVAAVVAAPARSFRGAQIKAEMVAWCCASRSDFGLNQNAGERVIASLLRDLLTPN